jgi:hypothetical protein
VSNTIPLTFQFGLQLKYGVVEAFLHTFSLLFLFSFMLGLLIFFLNSFVNRAIGIIATTMLVLLSLIPEWGQNPVFIIRCSPSSLTQIMYLDNQGTSESPTLFYAYMTLASISVALLFVTFLTVILRIRPYKKFKENMGGT